MIHEVKSWKFKECFIAGDEPDEVEYITDFDMSDDYISLTYRQFEIIKVSPTIYKHPSIFSVKSKEYFIDNTLRGVAMNPETLFAILAYAIGMVYVIKRHK